MPGLSWSEYRKSKGLPPEPPGRLLAREEGKRLPEAEIKRRHLERAASIENAAAECADADAYVREHHLQVLDPLLEEEARDALKEWKYWYECADGSGRQILLTRTEDIDRALKRGVTIYRERLPGNPEVRGRMIDRVTGARRKENKGGGTKIQIAFVDRTSRPQDVDIEVIDDDD